MTLTTIILGIIAILLVILFVWLLMREPQVVKPVAARPVEKVSAPAVVETSKVEMPVVSTPAPPVVEVPPVETAPAVEASPIPEAVPAGMAAAPVAEPTAVAAPSEDDLEIIEGIGPKIASVLKKAGVTTFAQLAAMEPDKIQEILHAANLRLADPHSWPEQARLAAAGDHVGLQALQDRLKGGREA